jgi:hypothetical protein
VVPYGIFKFLASLNEDLSISLLLARDRVSGFAPQSVGKKKVFAMTPTITRDLGQIVLRLPEVN